MSKIMPYLWVGLGGFLGANARYLVGSFVGSWYGARFPLGTFIINISGAFALGVIGTLVTDRLVPRPDELRLLIGIGFLGAYTTFSTFSYESHTLFDDGAWMSGISNLFVSPLLGLFAVHLGIVLARRWF